MLRLLKRCFSVSIAASLLVMSMGFQVSAEEMIEEEMAIEVPADEILDPVLDPATDSFEMNQIDLDKDSRAYSPEMWCVENIRAYPVFTRPTDPGKTWYYKSIYTSTSNSGHVQATIMPVSAVKAKELEDRIRALGDGYEPIGWRVEVDYSIHSEKPIRIVYRFNGGEERSDSVTSGETGTMYYHFYKPAEPVDVYAGRLTGYLERRCTGSACVKPILTSYFNAQVSVFTK